MHGNPFPAGEKDGNSMKEWKRRQSGVPVTDHQTPTQADYDRQAKVHTQDDQTLDILSGIPLLGVAAAVAIATLEDEE